MRFVVARVILAWGAMIIEQSRPDLLPAGAVLLPVVIAGMLWNRSAGGVVAGGVVLILDWIARRQGLPLLPVVLSLGVTLMLLQSSSIHQWGGRRTRVLQTPEWVQPSALTVVGIGLLTGPAIVAHHANFLDTLPVFGKYAMISLPLSVLLTVLMKLADEFGLRQST